MAQAVGGFGDPGSGAVSTTTERSIFWGMDNGRAVVTYMSGRLDSTTVDSTNSPTSVLRPGLLLGVITSSGNFVHYSPTATDGSNVAVGVLPIECRITDFDGTAVNRVVPIAVAGFLRGGKAIGIDGQSRAQLKRQFVFDDDLTGSPFPYKRVVAKTADYTVTAADNGTIFTNQGAAGAVTFTLPTIARGLSYTFAVEAGQTVTVAAAANTLVAYNNATATSIAFSTSSEKIGNMLTVFPNATATKWLSQVSLGFESSTLVVA